MMRGRDEAAMIDRTRFEWIKSMECVKLLHRKWSSPKLQGTADKSRVSSTILYGSKVHTYHLKHSNNHSKKLDKTS